MKKTISFFFALFFIASNAWSQSPFVVSNAERHKVFTIKEALTDAKVRALAIVQPSDLKVLVNNLAGFKHVEMITFYPKSIKTLPLSIAELKNLKVCLIGHDPKIDYNSVFQALIGVTSLQKLAVRGLDKIPAAMGTIQNLQVLDLSWGKFEHLPLFMSSLNVKAVDFSYCKKLTNDGVVSLLSNPTIVNLRFYGGRLERFPDIQGMKSLSLLDVSENGITELTCTASESSSGLQTLVISGNPLEKFDEAFFTRCFPSLKTVETTKIGSAYTEQQQKFVSQLRAQFPTLEVF